jgi:pyruvate dehydrogenase E1 component alpha subunit
MDRMMAELFGKQTGCCKGKGGSMHITDMSIGMLGANGIVAGGLPIALGAAYSASRLHRTDQVTVSFFGDGATAEGAFHETCNLAALWKLPIIFVCENNQFGVGTRVSDSSPFPDLIHRVDGYGIPAVSVDGNEVLAVREAAQKAVVNARQGRGPTFIECKTWRHHGHFEGEDPKYRKASEHQAWMARDPIEYFGRMLVESGVVSADLLAMIDAEALTSIDQAVRFAEESPYPQLAEALEDTFIVHGV